MEQMLDLTCGWLRFERRNLEGRSTRGYPCIGARNVIIRMNGRKDGNFCHGLLKLDQFFSFKQLEDPTEYSRKDKLIYSKTYFSLVSNYSHKDMQIVEHLEGERKNQILSIESKLFDTAHFKTENKPFFTQKKEQNEEVEFKSTNRQPRTINGEYKFCKMLTQFHLRTKKVTGRFCYQFKQVLHSNTFTTKDRHFNLFKIPFRTTKLSNGMKFTQGIVYDWRQLPLINRKRDFKKYVVIPVLRKVFYLKYEPEMNFGVDKKLITKFRYLWDIFTNHCVKIEFFDFDGNVFTAFVNKEMELVQIFGVDYLVDEEEGVLIKQFIDYEKTGEKSSAFFNRQLAL